MSLTRIYPKYPTHGIGKVRRHQFWFWYPHILVTIPNLLFSIVWDVGHLTYHVHPDRRPRRTLRSGLSFCQMVGRYPPQFVFPLVLVSLTHDHPMVPRFAMLSIKWPIGILLWTVFLCSWKKKQKRSADQRTTEQQKCEFLTTERCDPGDVNEQTYACSCKHRLMYYMLIYRNMMYVLLQWVVVVGIDRNRTKRYCIWSKKEVLWYLFFILSGTKLCCFQLEAMWRMIKRVSQMSTSTTESGINCFGGHSRSEKPPGSHLGFGCADRRPSSKHHTFFCIGSIALFFVYRNR